MELYPHQRKAVNELSSGKVLVGGTGVGKTMTALAYYAEKQSPKPLYVITTARKRDDLDWEREALDFTIGKTPESTIHGVLTVDSWNNISKYKDVEDAFFIFDEQRVVGTGAWVKSFLKISKNNEWILLTATPGDNWSDYAPLFIANGYFKNITEFRAEHVVYRPYVKFQQVSHYTGTAKLARLRRELLVIMPFERTTKRHTHIFTPEHNKENEKLILRGRWNLYKDRPIRNASDLMSALRRNINSDPSRVELLLDIFFFETQSKKLIVFYNFTYELEILRETLTSRQIVFKEWNGQKHEEVPDGDEWVYLVQYASGSEAWNCVATDSMVFYSLPYSYKMFMQAQGRIDRLNTKFTILNYYIFLSKSGIDLAIWRALKEKRDFNESEFVGSD